MGLFHRHQHRLGLPCRHQQYLPGPGGAPGQHLRHDHRRTDHADHRRELRLPDERLSGRRRRVSLRQRDPWPRPRFSDGLVPEPDLSGDPVGQRHLDPAFRQILPGQHLQGGPAVCPVRLRRLLRQGAIVHRRAAAGGAAVRAAEGCAGQSDGRHGHRVHGRHRRVLRGVVCGVQGRYRRGLRARQLLPVPDRAHRGDLPLGVHRV